jgi:hypothetical protein
MKAIKSFDFFQKISTEDVVKPTLLGALISLSAIFLIVYLLLREFMDFITPSIKKETIIYHDPDQFSKINVNLAVTFKEMPCHIISVDQQDSIGNHKMDIKDTLTKNIQVLEIFPSSKKYEPKGNLEIKDVEESVLKSEGCYINGKIPISKVSGNIHISHHNYGNIYKQLKYQKRDVWDKLSFSHSFALLYFGDVEVNNDILKRFGYNQNTSFNRLSSLPNYRNDKGKKNYDYFIKLIPHLFVDNTTGQNFMAYQYSVTSKASDFDTHSEGMPIIMLHYDISPITMKVVLERKSLTHSLTHICAIVGGIYVLFSLLNRMILAFFDWFNEQKV